MGFGGDSGKNEYKGGKGNGQKEMMRDTLGFLKKSEEEKKRREE